MTSMTCSVEDLHPIAQSVLFSGGVSSPQDLVRALEAIPSETDLRHALMSIFKVAMMLERNGRAAASKTLADIGEECCLRLPELARAGLIGRQRLQKKLERDAERLGGERPILEAPRTSDRKVDARAPWPFVPPRRV